jgi:hypothetical protein
VARHIWAPRIKAHLIHRLYESDAQGRLDEELLDRVGWELYSRCQGFLQADQACKGSAVCPTCGETVLHGLRKNDRLLCTACGWECLWGDYLQTIRNQQLNGGPEVAALFQEFVDGYPLAQKPAEKMVWIDRLIHGFHHFLRSGRTRRPVGVNLIDGDLQFVIEFLDQLSYGESSTPGLQETWDLWREKIHSQCRQRK